MKGFQAVPKHIIPGYLQAYVILRFLEWKQ